ncbi:hypothetical protein CLOP_g13378 [Closterium sp. NIES-67]|nr:hypothetical protein CLOP_g13378 [Closterium sp. NIES-67]
MCLPLRGNSAEISWTPTLVKISRELSVDSKGELKFQDQWTPEWLRQQILQEDFRRRHVGGGAATKTAEGYGAAGRGKGRGGWKGRGRGRSFGRGRGRDLLDEVKPPGKIKYVAAASGALLPVIGVGNAKVKGANGELVGLGNVLLVEATAAAAKATAGGDATAPTDGVLEAVKKVQQQQTHSEVLAGVDASAA